MKRISIAFVATILFASSGFAGLTYDFTSTTTGMGNQTISGSVKAEAKNIRIDVATGDGTLFQNGSYVISTDGGETMNVFDPAAKTFYQLNLGQLIGGADTLLQQLGPGVKLDVRNPKVSVNPGGAAGTVEGFPVQKSIVTSAYEIAVEGLGVPMVMQMQLTSDVWWTERIPQDFTNFLQMRGFRTGVEAVDRLLAAEAGAIKGFPLKQVTTTRVSFGGNDMTTTSTSTVSNLKQVAVPPAAFAVPAGFTRVESPIERMVSGARRQGVR